MSEVVTPCQNNHKTSPLASPESFSKWSCYSNFKVIASLLQNSKLYLAPVHEHVKVPLKNAVHHFSESEFSPLAALAAATASFAVKDKQTSMTDCTDMCTAAVVRPWSLYVLCRWLQNTFQFTVVTLNVTHLYTLQFITDAMLWLSKVPCSHSTYKLQWQHEIIAHNLSFIL